MLPNRVKLSGIVYRSFLREDTLKKGRIRIRLEWFRYLLMAKSKKMEKVLLLNDSQSAEAFNKSFDADKFVRLPDPYTPLEGEMENIKELLGIDASDNFFVQIGQLSGRKGTLEILDALCMLSSEEKIRSHFYFAGKVAGGIRKEFYARVGVLKSRGVHISILC